MQYIIFILLGLFIVHLVIRLRKKEMQLLELQTKLYQMQTETEQAVRTAKEATAIKDEIRDHINTIHPLACFLCCRSIFPTLPEAVKEPPARP